ncbi:hypothetical protein ACIA5A_30730, partial [Micromonospora sp. NPDC051300]
MSDEATTPDGGAPTAVPPTATPPTSRRRALWVATGVAGLTGVVGLAALGGLAARDDKAGGPERAADNRAAASRDGDDAHGGARPGEDGDDRGGEEDHGGAREIPCDDDALVDALELANRDHGGTLKLAENCTYELRVEDRAVGGGLPEITQDVTIRGNGSTIARDAEDAFRIFRVAGGGHLTLDDLTISGGNAAEARLPGRGDGKRGEGDGGALLVERGGKAHLSDVTLTGNNAEHDGGAVANYGRVWLTGSTVVGNHAQGDGGGIVNHGLLTIEESHVDRNTAAGSGGGVANGGEGRRGQGAPVALTALGLGEHGRRDAGTVEIVGARDGKDASRSTLDDNRAGKNGGGLFSSGGYVTVSFTHVTGNTACE